MSKYFQFFPTTYHDLTNNGQRVILTNILRRFTVESSIKDTVGVYHEYAIQAGDRPDTIAKKYYGDSGYAWLVLMFNGIDDPIFGWPLEYTDFEEYIKGKYGSIATAQSTVHEYRKILNPSSLVWNDELEVYENKRNADGSIVTKRAVVVDLTTYNTLADTAKESVSKWDWELEENEKKRFIRILDRKYLSKIRSEVKSILRSGV